MRRLLAISALALIAMAAVGVWAVQTEPDWFVRLRYPLQYEAIIKGHSQQYDLPPALVAAVIYAESGFDPRAKSSAGALGLMQLLPATAQGIADRTGGSRFRPRDLYDPELNVRYGSWYLSNLRTKYADHPQALELALAAYNAGQGNVDRWVESTPPGAVVRIPFAETRAYIVKVKRLQDLYRRAYGLR
jgi:soluble lytic murein transglycosylase